MAIKVREDLCAGEAWRQSSEVAGSACLREGKALGYSSTGELEIKTGVEGDAEEENVVMRSLMNCPKVLFNQHLTRRAH